MGPSGGTPRPPSFELPADPVRIQPERSAHFTPQAEIDLEEVGDYIALDNPGRAVSFIGEIRRHCEKIAGGPDHYAARPDLGDTIRICAHGNYLIVFEPFDDGALILRVLHGARNVPGVLCS